MHTKCKTRRMPEQVLTGTLKQKKNRKVLEVRLGIVGSFSHKRGLVSSAKEKDMPHHLVKDLGNICVSLSLQTKLGLYGVFHQTIVATPSGGAVPIIREDMWRREDADHRTKERCQSL
ncbi:hypothetical protein COCNU_scaffold003260G000040 [Cocos nucifera]|nr:hypothetical protein [Cocos nucifera]